MENKPFTALFDVLHEAEEHMKTECSVLIEVTILHQISKDLVKYLTINRMQCVNRGNNITSNK